MNNAIRQNKSEFNIVVVITVQPVLLLQLIIDSIALYLKMRYKEVILISSSFLLSVHFHLHLEWI